MDIFCPCSCRTLPTHHIIPHTGVHNSILRLAQSASQGSSHDACGACHFSNWHAIHAEGAVCITRADKRASNGAASAPADELLQESEGVGGRCQAAS